MTMQTFERQDGEVVAVAGAPRSGKTSWMVQQTREHPRVIAWDIRGEYGEHGFDLVTGGLAQLLTRLLASKDSAARIAYKGAPEDFRTFCWGALRWGMFAPCTILVDELADVTNPGKAPGEWGEICRKGAGYGLHVYGATQRPAETDSTLWGTATLFHVHRLMRSADRIRMSRELDVDEGLIAQLAPLEYLERAADSAQIQRGRVVF